MATQEHHRGGEEHDQGFEDVPEDERTQVTIPKDEELNARVLVGKILSDRPLNRNGAKGAMWTTIVGESTFMVDEEGHLAPPKP